MGKIIDCFVIHHGSNNAYYAWIKSVTQDLVIDEKFCPPNSDILAKWIEVELNRSNRPCGPVRVLPDRYIGRKIGSNAEVRVDIEHKTFDGKYDHFGHNFFGHVSDPRGIIRTIQKESLYDVWIANRKIGDSHEWIVTGLNGLVAKERRTDQQRSSEYTNGPRRVEESEKPRSNGFDYGPDLGSQSTGRRQGYNSGIDNNYCPEYKEIRRREASGYTDSMSRSREGRRRSYSPENGYQYQENYRNDRRNEERFSRHDSPIRNSSIQQSRYRSRSPERRNNEHRNDPTTTVQAGRRKPSPPRSERSYQDDYNYERKISSSGTESQRFLRNSSPMRSRSFLNYESENEHRMQRRRTRSPKVRNSQNVSQADDRRTFDDLNVERTSQKEYNYYNRRSPSPRVSRLPMRASPSKTRSRSSSSAASTVSRAETTDSEVCSDTEDVKSKQSHSTNPPENRNKRDETVSVHEQVLPVTVPSRSETDTEIRKLRSKLIRMKRLLASFLTDEALVLSMKQLGLEEYEDLEQLLNSIETA
uniref:Tudor domain-containing protein n=1 Tax=Caenorhabditis tropicalis TaxID=1561998 RepID=A0A1I7T0L1_9PELO